MVWKNILHPLPGSYIIFYIVSGSNVIKHKQVNNKRYFKKAIQQQYDISVRIKTRMIGFYLHVIYFHIFFKTCNN